jgi:hypothetical protein
MGGWGCFRIYRPSSVPSFGLGRCDRRHKLLFGYPIIFWTPRGSLNHVERALGQSRQAVNLSLGHFAYTRLAHAAACPGICRVRSRARRWLRALKRIYRPFFGEVGLSCAYCEKEALRRGSVGTDCFLKLPG